jgi:hypothetical protein
MNSLALRIRKKKCYICGKRAVSDRSRYCLTCARFAFRMKARQFPPWVVKKIWEYVRKYGYVCYYTGMPLNMDDPRSAFYCVFDHWAPHDLSKIVITSALINGMKSDLSEKEFWYYVRALANYRRKNIPVKKRKLTYWDHHYELKEEKQAVLDIQALSLAHTGKCDLCGKKLKNKLFTYCSDCVKIVYRLRHEAKHLPPETIEDTLDYIRQEGFVCFYTKMKLNMKDPASPWYCFLNHWRPGDVRKVVITSALVNVMKGALTEDEFWYYIEALADYKEKGKKIRKRSPVFWNRRLRAKTYGARG